MFVMGYCDTSVITVSNRCPNFYPVNILYSFCFIRLRTKATEFSLCGESKHTDDGRVFQYIEVPIVFILNHCGTLLKALTSWYFNLSALSLFETMYQLKFYVTN
jgi:hypothetical protein